MLLSKHVCHKNGNILTIDLCSIVPETLSEAMTSLHYLSTGLFVSADMNDDCFIAEEYLAAGQHIFICTCPLGPELNLLGLVRKQLPLLLVVSYCCLVLGVHEKSLWIVRINLAKKLPVAICLSCRIDYAVVELAEEVEVRDHICKVGPELKLIVADFLDLLSHFLIKSFELLDIGELFISVRFFLTLILNTKLDHVLVAIDRELLVDVGSLLRCDLKLMKRSMYVVQHMIVEVSEEDVDKD